MMTSWLNLPSDLVNTIGELLDSYADFVRLRAVCASWRSLLNSPTQPLTPWLMLPFDDGESDTPWLKSDTHRTLDTHRPFFSFIDKKTYKLDLPETRNRLFRGSVNGWLITQDVDSPELYLFNPLTRDKINLPPLTAFPNVISYHREPGEEDIPGYELTANDFIGTNYFLFKVVLTTAPTLGNNDDNGAGYLAVAIHGPYRLIAFCKRGDEKWTAASAQKCFLDVIFHENKVYAVSVGHGYVRIHVSELNSSLNFVEIPLELSSEQINTFRESNMGYLVSCGLGLLVVLRYHADEEILKTERFMVYRVDTNLHKCFEVKSLGDYTLFVGLNASFAIPSQSRGLKGNCIYYTDDQIDLHDEGVEGGQDFGVYNMKDGKISKLEGYQGRDSLLYWPYPIWVVPNAVSSIEFNKVH